MNRLPAWQSALMRAAATAVSPGGGRGSLLVLIFHRVLPEPDPMLPDEPDARTFAEQMDLVSDLFNVISLSEAVERLAANALPSRAVAITFDDGYANNLEIAAPILSARGLTATFFVATGYIDGGCMFNDTVIQALRVAPEKFDLSDLGLGEHRLADVAARRKAMDEILPKLKYLVPSERLEKAELIAARAGLVRAPKLMMSELQLRELASLGMDIGAHCVTHPILTRVAPDEARREIIESKMRLEAILGTPVLGFAYPNGRPGNDYGPEHVKMIREAGFTVAVSTAWGAASRGSDPYQLPRIAPWDKTAFMYGTRVLRGFAERRPQLV